MLVNSQDILLKSIEEHQTIIGKLFASVSINFERLVMICAEALLSGNKIILFGNGGSAGDAQHIAAELVVRFRKSSRPLSAIALTTDTSVILAIGNDFGFDLVFSRQVDALARREDVAIGISTTGKSQNVLEGMRAARISGCRTVGLTGENHGNMHEFADLILSVPSHDTARIQEVHILLGHALCEALEQIRV